MAIPACVDPNACGTNVTFNTSGIRVDVELDNSGCGIDLSCSAAGVRADVRAATPASLANQGGIGCDAGTRQVFVRRLGNTAAANPGNCYDPINIDPSGQLWTPKATVVAQAGPADAAFENVPVLNASATFYNNDPLPGGWVQPLCAERWLGYISYQLNIQARPADEPNPGDPRYDGITWIFGEFRLSFGGIASAPAPVVERVGCCFNANASNRSSGQWGTIPFILNINPGDNPSFSASFETKGREGLRVSQNGGNHSVVMQGFRMTRIFRRDTV